MNFLTLHYRSYFTSRNNGPWAWGAAPWMSFPHFFGTTDISFELIVWFESSGKKIAKTSTCLKHLTVFFSVVGNTILTVFKMIQKKRDLQFFRFFLPIFSTLTIRIHCNVPSRGCQKSVAKVTGSEHMPGRCLELIFLGYYFDVPGS